MSVRLSPNPGYFRPRDLSRDSSAVASSKSLVFCYYPSSSLSSLVCSRKFEELRGAKWAISVQNAPTTDHEGSLRELDDVDSPASVELSPVSGESHFDRVIAEAQQLGEPVIFVWMASWCRKCIYLKPKLEKLAADYYSRLRFYCVDVNAVPHKLVSRAGVTKMPTIQLWKNGNKQAEVIGGHKAYVVINEVREMIENETAM